MKIQKFEQSGFVLETEKGFRLAFDIANKTSEEKTESIGKVNAMIISHIHGDHFYLPNIKILSPDFLYLNHECLETIGEEDIISKIIEIKDGDNSSIGEINVKYFSVDHGPNISSPVENLGFLIEVEGKKIYFCGDMFFEPNHDVSEMEVDYLLLPVGSHYTFGPQEAFNFAKKFKKINKIIPMHYEKNNFIDPIRLNEFVGIANGFFEIEN